MPLRAALLGAALLAACGTGATATESPTSATSPLPANPLDYTGINFWAGAGNEQMVHGGEYGVDYGYDSASIPYFHDAGMNVFRLHVRWEVIQKELMAPLDVDELGHLDEFVTAASGAGSVTIIAIRDGARYQFADANNKAEGDPQLIGSSRVPTAAFADLWRQLAARYEGNDDVWFNLMNEPHDMPTVQWIDAANEALRAIRETGAANRVLVPANNVSHGYNWSNPDNGTDGVPNSEGMLGIVDPADNWWLDIHEYVNGEMDDRECLSRTAYSVALAEVTAWLHEHDRQAFLGEFGTGPGDDCLAALENLLTMLEREREVWPGWAYFSAALGLEHEDLSIATSEPKDPRMTILERHAGGSR